MVFHSKPEFIPVEHFPLIIEIIVTDNDEITLTDIPFCHILVENISESLVKAQIYHRHADRLFDFLRNDSECQI